MKVIIDGHEHHYEMECLTKLFFRTEKITVSHDIEDMTGDYVYTGLEKQAENTMLFVKVSVDGQKLSDARIIPNNSETYALDCERGFGALVYLRLSQVTGIYPKWGILTGIRPVKLFHQCFAKGMNEAEVREHFRTKLLLSEEKIDLAMRTQKIEKEILKLSTGDSFSLYISIPFCPTRCSYCSFVSHSIDKTYKLIPAYIERLTEELRHTATIAKDLGLKLRTVYFGGGTPTTIDAVQLKTLTDTIAECFDFSHLLEYTVEAGRPDTITEEKLQVLLDAGVSRISINPQTFDDAVLEKIGRKHSAQDIIDAYQLARCMGFGNINMDLIAGLPDDTLEGFMKSLDTAIALAPENITVHSLSLKRSSTMAEQDISFLKQANLVSNMIDYSQKALYDRSYNPYYLYRQKNTMDNLENVGFAKTGFEGAYNVYIMDETHTILAVGAGAVTKLKSPHSKELVRIFNYKFPYEYLDRFEQIISRKEQVREFYEVYRL